MADDALGELSKAIAQGAKFKGDMRPLIEALFGERYNKRHLEKTSIRDAFGQEVRGLDIAVMNVLCVRGRHRLGEAPSYGPELIVA